MELKLARQKAATLVEALPYIKRFRGKTVVVKYGGNAMIDQQAKEAVIMDLVLMRFVGMRVVVVHGGGPDIANYLDRMQIESEFVNGLRKTTKEAMEVVEMVLSGKVNKEIVAGLNFHGGSAIGLSGKDDSFIKAKKKKLSVDGKDVDLGYVGEIDSVNTKVLRDLLDDGFIVVVAPIGVDNEQNTYNINADTAAAEVASALNADKFLLLTDVEGVYDDKEKVSRLTPAKIDLMIKSGAISGGMLPKVECCVNALNGGVGQVHIIDGRMEHSMLLEIFTDTGIGTMIKKDN